MKRKSVVVWGFIALMAVVLSLSACSSSAPQISAQETVYDRVIKSGTIRCAYIVYPPSTMKDPNTGKLSGIAVETIQEVGRKLDLKIEFTEETAWGQMIEGLEANRYDLVVSGIWPNASRAKRVDFTRPLFYSGIGVYVRSDDNRFADLTAINNESIKTAAIDGEMSDIISREDYPKAARISLPQTADVSQVLLNVAQKKADVTFVEPYIGFQFLKNNQGTVKNLTPDRPVRIFGNTMMLRRGQMEFKNMLDTAIEQLINSGFVYRLLDQHEGVKGAFYRADFPYRQPTAK